MIERGSEAQAPSFYAEQNPGLYGSASDLDTPQYSLMSETFHALLGNYLNELNYCEQDQPIFLLDVGSGIGTDSIQILQKYANVRVVAFDRCSPVHELYRDNARQALQQVDISERCQNVVGDITSDTGSVRALLHPLKRWGRGSRYDIIISVLTLHHLTKSERLRTYRRFYSALEPGGLFINADLFSYSSSTMARHSNEFGIHWIEKQFSNPDPHLRSIRDSLGESATRIKEAWIAHCLSDNFPGPIESIPKGEKRSQKMGQAEMLFDIGFSEVACPFRYWGIGILWARR